MLKNKDSNSIKWMPLAIAACILLVLACGIKVYAGEITGNSQMYMCGVMAMGFMAAGILFYSYKRKKQEVEETA